MSGNLDQRTELVPASGVVALPPANFIFVLTSTGNAALKLVRLGSTVRGANAENYGTSQLAGLQVARTQPWDFATITAAPGVTVTFIYGTVSLREDLTSFNQQIATVAGVVTTAVAPSSTIVDTADTAQAINTQTVIAANLARRRITIGVLASSTENVRVSQAGGAGRGIQIQPGTFTEFDTTAALTVRNNNDNATGNAATWYAEEES